MNDAQQRKSSFVFCLTDEFLVLSILYTISKENICFSFFG